MIKVFLIVMSCLKPNFTYCEQLMVTEIVREVDPMRWCLLNRPWAASLWQRRLKEGWLTFTRCEFVNTEKNGRLG